MSTEVRFGRSVAWMAVGSWVEQGCNILFFVLLARILGAEAFGLVAMATAFVIFAESLVRESVSEYLIAARTPAPGHFSAAFWMSQVLARSWARLCTVSVVTISS